LRDQAPHDVDRPAGREGHQQPDRPGRILFLGVRGGAEADQQSSKQKIPSIVYQRFTPSLAGLGVLQAAACIIPRIPAPRPLTGALNQRAPAFSRMRAICE
jgi:hypothetical protein